MFLNYIGLALISGWFLWWLKKTWNEEDRLEAIQRDIERIKRAIKDGDDAIELDSYYDR